MYKAGQLITYKTHVYRCYKIKKGMTCVTDCLWCDLFIDGNKRICKKCGHNIYFKRIN